MGRFDALINIEEKQKVVKPPAASSPTLQTQTEQQDKEQNKEIKKPASPQAGKTANLLTRKPARLKTRKPTSQQKGLLLTNNLEIIGE